MLLVSTNDPAMKSTSKVGAMIKRSTDGTARSEIEILKTFESFMIIKLEIE